MRKIALLFILLFSAVATFYAARNLPNQVETFDLSHKGSKARSEIAEEEPQREPSKVIVPPTPEPKDTREVWPPVEDDDKEDDYQRAKSYLDQGKDKEFVRILEKNPRNRKEWLELLIEYSVKNQDYAQLVVIYHHDPEIFRENEEAAALLGKALIDSGKDSLYWGLRKEWEGREQKESSWIVLDADAYLFQGRRDDAIDQLKSKEFHGKEDVPRLYRLALLHLAENPKKAYEWLTKAKTIDPENAEVLSYRGKILEMAGKKDLAFGDYYEAWSLNPLNGKSIAQLSDFYFRQNDFGRALEILSKNFDKTEDNALLIKALFLGKVIKPFKIPKKQSLSPYVQYLGNLSPWEFWDESTFDRIKSHNSILETEQSAFWLRLLSHLKNGEKQEALELLRENPFASASWNPELELSLKEILIYQLYGSLSLANRDLPLSKLEKKARDSLSEKNTFLGRLTNYALRFEEDPYLYIPQEDKDILSGDLAYVSALLETNWIESALNIYRDNEGAKPPKWLTLELAKGYEANRSYNKALEFALGQNESPELNLFLANLLVREGKTDAAIKKLNEIREQTGAVALDASWLKSLILIDKGDYARARAEIQLNIDLDQSVRGKELLAKAALLEGRGDLAEEIYTHIAAESLEAKSYLARRYFEKGNYPLARKLTIELLEKNPSSEILKKNLTQIESAN